MAASLNKVAAEAGKHGLTDQNEDEEGLVATMNIDINLVRVLRLSGMWKCLWNSGTTVLRSV